MVPASCEEVTAIVPKSSFGIGGPSLHTSSNTKFSSLLAFTATFFPLPCWIAFSRRFESNCFNLSVSQSPLKSPFVSTSTENPGISYLTSSATSRTGVPRFSPTGVIAIGLPKRPRAKSKDVVYHMVHAPHAAHYARHRPKLLFVQLLRSSK